VTMVHILQARLKVMLRFVCDGLHDQKSRYWSVSVGLQYSIYTYLYILTELITSRIWKMLCVISLLFDC
jgi:hypothetical protein